MKIFIEKLPLNDGNSFFARTCKTPAFETPYHQHNEYELMVIKKSTGTAFVGDFIGDYQQGDVYLHGSNLPHWYRKKKSDMIAISIVIQFRDDFLGNKFFDIPEMKSLKELLNNSAKGLFLTGNLREKIGKKLSSIENKNTFLKLLDLLTMLYEISISNEYHFLSPGKTINHSVHEQILIHKVFEFTMENFQRKVPLEEVAEITSKSVSAFCHYFKKKTKMSYVQFLTQIRIAHACSLLKDSDLSITQICYESGFHNWANFSKHFKERCKMSPKEYRSNLV